MGISTHPPRLLSAGAAGELRLCQQLSSSIDYAGPSRFVPASGDAVELDDPDLPGNHRFDREIAHFVNCILGEETPEIPAEEGVADLRVLEAAFQSIGSGRAVAV